MLQTTVAFRATDLAESFRSTVGKLRVGPLAYTPDLTAPEGPSTGGGTQALAHVRLLPPQPNMPTLVVGHVNIEMEPPSCGRSTTWRRSAVSDSTRARRSRQATTRSSSSRFRGF